MSNNLDVSQVATNQANKETTINDATGQLDAAITEFLSSDASAGNVTLTSNQFRRNVRFIVTGVPAMTPRNLILPAVKHLFIVSSDSGNSDDVNVVRGATSLPIIPGADSIFYTDGTTDGLIQLGGGGSAGQITYTPTSPETDTDLQAVVDTLFARTKRMVGVDKTANFTLSAAEAGQCYDVDLGTAVTAEVPLNATVAIPIDTVYSFYQKGVGQVQLSAEGGVTLRYSSDVNPYSRDQYSVFSVRKQDTNVWVVYGDLEIL